MWLGRYQLGDWVDFPVRAMTAAGVATQPHTTGDRAPVAHIYKGTADATGHIETLRLPSLDPAGSTGLFHGRFRLSSSYAAGNYLIVVTWGVSSGGFYGHKEFAFSIVGGGSATGAVTSLAELDRPEAEYVVGLYDSGVLFQGRNPY